MIPDLDLSMNLQQKEEIHIHVIDGTLNIYGVPCPVPCCQPNICGDAEKLFANQDTNKITNLTKMHNTSKLTVEKKYIFCKNITYMGQYDVPYHHYK